MIRKVISLILISVLLISCSNSNISSIVPDVILIDDFAYAKGNDGQFYLSRYIGESENLVIPSSFTYKGIKYDVGDIGGKAIWYNDNIKTVVISEGIKRIYDFNFCECSNIETISLPNSIEMLGENVVVGTKIKTLTLPDRDIRCADSTFQSNKYLETVYTGHSKSAVACFFGCQNLKNLYITSEVNSKDNTYENIMALGYITSKVLTNVVIEGDGYLSFTDGKLYFKDKVLYPMSE